MPWALLNKKEEKKLASKRLLFLTLLAAMQAPPAWPRSIAVNSDAVDENPAGTGTVRDKSANAFGFVLKGVTVEQNGFFGSGNSFFRQPWVKAPSSTSDQDGLGPVFNATSCGACHNKDGRGIGYRKGKVDLSLLFRLSHHGANGDSPHPLYGDQLNPSGILGVPGEGKVKVIFAPVVGNYPDGEAYGLQQPVFDFSGLTYGAIGPEAIFSPRVAPQVIGLGLVENIPPEQILEIADPEDADGDGISGRPNWVANVENGLLQLGRFGWKANQPSLRQQVAGAFSGDMGLTSALFPQLSCMPNQLECLAAISGGDPEVSDGILGRVIFYSQTLSVPARRAPKDPEVVRGKALFHQVQCASCHHPNFTTGFESPIEVLNRQSIWPYSDFLLHDMGEALADHRPDGQASGREWRTPPLWGIGLLKVVSGHTNLLHDARARNVEEAILWHGGEAEKSRDAFKNLSKADREALLRFVEDL